ncbi:MAG: carbamoyltransferase HypF [Planctomycetota bacterium]
MQDEFGSLIRRRLHCRGVVQGVGFRPAVYRLGGALGLAGFVRNDADGATIEVEGTADDVARFEARLPASLPPLARLAQVESTSLPPTADRGFVVAATRGERRGQAMVPADAALCRRCRAEVETAGDRRFRYPFTNCTDCGPRFTLVRSLPYDRARTTMACFGLCPECAREYADPRSRRFHAEAICCPRCGPRLWVCGADGQRLADGADALATVRRFLSQGAIVAVKGLGGFQLACRADTAAPVLTLRQRKRRPRKPLAVMARDLGVAHRLVQLSARDADLLQSTAGPIVLAPRHRDAPLAAEVAPGIDDVGVMLPTTALHVELLRDAPFPAVVLTSGNRSDEPICLGNREAMARLADIADAFLLHDRDIARRVDDSVVRATAGTPVLVRRSRGYAPDALPLPVRAPTPILAVGGHLQTTACVAVGGQAFLSQHVGDLDTEKARAFLREVALQLEAFLEVEAATLAADAHPDYPSTWLAQELATARGARLLPVPHHLAHAAAVLAEHDAFPAAGSDALALVLDGTGFGPDGTAWGCELLRVHGDLRFARLAFGEALPLVGGEAAVREPWRIAQAVLAVANPRLDLDALPLAHTVERRRRTALAALARSAWPEAHGAGRLFEAAGAVLGLCVRNEYEGEAAACLEAAAARGPDRATPWPEVVLDPDRAVLPQRALLVAAARRLLAGETTEHVARGLHVTFAELWAALICRCVPSATTVALGGGCLVNRLLRADLERSLAARGLRACAATDISPGDGGLAYGQAVVAAVAGERGCRPSFIPSSCPY